MKSTEDRLPAPVLLKLSSEIAAPTLLREIAAEVATLVRAGEAVVVVHDADRQVGDLERQVKADRRFVARRRLMDAPALQHLKMGLGLVNQDLCAALQAAGVQAVGLHTALRDERRGPQVYGRGVPVDLGAYGDLSAVDLPLLRLLLYAGRVPVLACIGLSTAGEALGVSFEAAVHLLLRTLPCRRLLLLAGATDEPMPQRGAALTVQQARARLRDVPHTIAEQRLSEACLALELGAVAECVIASYRGRGLSGGEGATIIR